MYARFYLPFISLVLPVVHATDSTRMELVIPGEQYFYLKAGGAAERQKWLVALGSSKACLGDSRSQKEKGWFLVNSFVLMNRWAQAYGVVGRAG